MTGRLTTTAPLLKTVIWLFDSDGRTPITYTESIKPSQQPLEEFTFEQSAILTWQADRTGPIYASVELLPADTGQTYGATTRYWLTIGELQRSYILMIVGPEPTPTPTPVPAATNDDFAQPVIVAPLPFNHIIDTTNATTADDDPILCTGSTGGATVWYRLTAPSSGEIQVNTFGSAYDTVLAVFTGERGAVTQLACNDDSGSLQSRVTFGATEGMSYYIEVASFYRDSVGATAPPAAVTAKQFVAPARAQLGGLLSLSVSYGDGAASALDIYPATPVPIRTAP